MKLNKYQDIVLVVALLMILYVNPPFLSKLTESVLGKLVLIVAVIGLTQHNGCLGGLAALVFMSLVHTNREGLDGIVKPDNGDHDKKEKKGKKGKKGKEGKANKKKKDTEDDSEDAEGMDDMEGMDHEGEEEEEDLEDGEGMDDMEEGMADQGQGDTVQASAKKGKDLPSIGTMNAKQMSKITEQLMGYKDMLTGKERIERGGYNSSA